MSFDPQRITYIGETDYRNKKVKFGIRANDRTRHMYIIGKTGTGKSTLLENMAVQDIQNGEGFAFLDPHGKTADLLLDYIPEHRINDVLYFAPFDLANPISFNVMEDIGPDKRHLVASGLMSAFKKIWVDAWSARMEYMLSNTILALLEYPDSTLLGISRMFADKEFRKEVVSHVTDPGVKSFWENEFANYTDKFAAEATPAIQNKIGQFTANPVIRNLIGQPKSTFNIREMMDQRKIIIINLSKGQVGEDSANLLGSMLITKIYLAAMSRADMREPELAKLPNFYLYVDEFQSFANESFADILSEARKYKLNLTIAHQYIEQMSDEVRAAVFGNVGTMITFRVGATDAEYLEKEFAPAFTAEDLVNIGFAQVYMKLMIDGMASAPFSAHTLGPIAVPHISYRDVAIARSRAQFARPRQDVEDEIIAWHQKSFNDRERDAGGRGGYQRDQSAGGRPSSAKASEGEHGRGRDDRSPSRQAPPPMREMLGQAAQQTSAHQSSPDRGPAPTADRSHGPRPPQTGAPQRNSDRPRTDRPPERRRNQTPVERETELRKVLSLDRLKAEQAPRRDMNKTKDPTPEKLSDLKSALEALLEKAGGETQPAADNQQQQPAPASQPKQQPKQQEVFDSTQSRRLRNAEGRDPDPKASGSKPQEPRPAQPQQKTPSVSEVPEAVLKDLFKE